MRKVRRVPINVYHSWRDMKVRCYDKTSIHYFYDGAKGIKVCSRWLDEVKGLDNFYSDLGKKPKGFVLHRINKSLDFKPSNCKWISAFDENRSKGITKLKVNQVKEIKRLISSGKKIVDIAKKFNIRPTTISAIKNGITWKNI